MRFTLILCAVLSILFYKEAAAQNTSTPYVLLVSFDGFRYDYLSKVDCPNIKAFIKEGTQAEALIPCYPSKTFPNHYTIVTGQYPGNTGLVDNSFYDIKREEKFNMKNVNPYYYGGTPIWGLAQKKGIKTASFFWVGSEVPFDNQLPDYYFHYSDTVSNSTRVNQVAKWLQLPEKERPHFITLYFSLMDDAGHDYSPESNEVKTALLQSDKIIGQLISEVNKTKLPVNVFIVSDHGMKTLTYTPETYIHLDQIWDLKDTSMIVVNNGTLAHIYLKNKTLIEPIYQKLKTSMNHFTVYKNAELPPQWHYSVERVGDVLITAEPGWELTMYSKDQVAKKMTAGKTFGVHGYDPDMVKEMHGIFYAKGPNIKSGLTIPAFRNIHIYPLIAKILNLETPPIDGSIKVLENIYRP